MSDTVYAVADCHGQLDNLHRTLDLIETDRGSGAADAPVVFLGDYVDRGPDSRGVLDLLSECLAAHPDWVALKGNHDLAFRDAIRGPEEPLERIPLVSRSWWLADNMGGSETLESYGVDTRVRSTEEILADARDAVPQAHLELLDSLKLWHERDDLLFVHAGIRPGVALEDQTEDDLVWIREGFLDHEGPFSHLVVHGHSPVRHPFHYGNRVNLDAGRGRGTPIHAAAFEAGGVFLLTENGREPLEPPQSR